MHLKQLVLLVAVALPALDPAAAPAGFRELDQAAAIQANTGQPDDQSPSATQARPTADETAPSSASTPPESPPLSPVAKDPKSYRYWVFAPALVAILFAIFTRQVVPSLVVGVLVGAYMLVPCLGPAGPFGESHPVIRGIRLAAEEYVLGALLDPKSEFGHMKIILFTLVIGFMVGAIGRNGGTAGMVRLVTGGTSSPRRGELTAWFSGLVVFFDDYANAMIIGPTMAPVFDRLKISRAKLAYIVDSTCAPVASLAIIGTWVGAEIGYITTGLEQIQSNDAPAFLSGMTGMSAFINSLPYRFYPILTLVLVFLVAYTGRDFGPMRRSQRLAVSESPPQGILATVGGHASTAAPPRWWLGFFPVCFLVVVTLVILAITGYRGMDRAAWDGDPRWWARAGVLIGSGDAYVSIFYGAIAAAFTAVLLTLFARACPTKDTVDAGLEGMARMMPAIVILVLAWAISEVSQDLRLGEIASDYLRQAQFAPQWLPLAVFVASALISFATGTSWTTMGILCPVTVTVAAHLLSGVPPETGLPLFYSAVGSVLAGSIFGDHCSPISDTTVLSSIASGCPHEEHVWTQLPYALLTALVAILVGNVLRDVYGQPWWVGMIAGAVILWILVLLIGRRAQPYGRVSAPPVRP